MEVQKADPITLGPRDPAWRAVGQRPVQFTLRCRGVQTYLLLADAAGRPIALNEMTHDGDAWRLTLHLPPGGYRYRYYVSDGSSIVYFSPADTDPVGRVTRIDGMDAVFDVAPPSDCWCQMSCLDRDSAVVRPKSGYACLPPSYAGHAF